MRKSRAEKAGIKTAESIIENTNLFYQKNTAKNFYIGLLKTLNKAIIKKFPEEFLQTEKYLINTGGRE